MDEQLIIELEDYKATVKKLEDFGVDIKQSIGQGFILPIKSEDNIEILNDLTPDVKKYFLNEQTSIEVLRTPGKEVRYLVLHDANVILPTITFVGGFALSVGAGILANLITNKFLSNNNVVKTDIINIKTETMECKRYKIEGSGKDVVKILETLSKKEGK